MRTLETDSPAIPLPASEEACPATQRGNYDAVRFNAMRHGILSRYTVLSHEDADEYRALLTALVAEHQPAGATEAHLVEELAGIIWRKRRVLMAEGAEINRGTLSVATKRYDPASIHALGPAPAAAPFEIGGISTRLNHPNELAEVVKLAPEEVAERQAEARRDLEAALEAAATLKRRGARGYRRALTALPPSLRDWWEQCLEDKEYPPTAEGLAEFIREDLEPGCRTTETETRFHEAIKSQILGEGFQLQRLENLSRYETHLDRKFERTLAMLLKLKELRGRR